jgi:hypothetical protein
MKSKNALLSMIFGLAIVLAIALQSVHSYDHISRAFSDKQCHHKYAANKTELGHCHLDSDHCFACEFTFSNSIKSDIFSIDCSKSTILKKYTLFYSKEIAQSFRGSLFALRAPPRFIV